MAFNLGDIFVTFKAKTDDLKNGVENVKRLTNQTEKTVNGTSFRAFSQGASTAFGSVANSIQGVVTKAAILATTSSVGLGTFIKSAADLQQTSKSFEVLTGNVDVANKLFAKLAKYANTTPFEFPQIAKAGQILLGFGIQSDQVYKRVTMLGDIAAATGANFESLALVFGQVNATGRLMGQDALQLINNKIPITSILAKKLGINVQEVKKRMEEGAIGVDAFNEALEETTKKGGFAFKGTEILAQSLNGRLSTLKDTVLEFGRNLVGVKVDPELGLVIKPGGLFDRFSNLVPKISQSLQEITPRVTKAFEWIFEHGDEVKAILGAIVTAFVAAKVAAIGLAIAANPLPFMAFGIAAAITALVGVLAFLFIRFEDVRNQIINFFKPSLDALWNTIQTQLIPTLTRLWHEVIEPLVPVIGTILVGAIRLAIDIVNALFRAITPVVNFLITNKDFLIPIIAGFAALRGAMMLGAAFDAIKVGFATLKLVQIPSMMASLAALRTAFIAAFPMAAVVAVVFAAFNAIQDKARETARVIDSTNKNIERSTASANDAIRRLGELKRSGTPEQQARATQSLNNILMGRAIGGPVEVGRPYIVGEKGPEIFWPSSNGMISSNKDSQNMFERQINQTNNLIVQGDIGSRDTADYVLGKMGRNQELAAKGLATQQGSLGK